MRKLLNTLFVCTPDAYLSIEGETVLVSKKEEELLRVPLHNIEGIVTFGYTGASPALIGECAKRGILLSFCNMYGRFLASVIGEVHGNVHLRRTQYRIADDEQQSLRIAQNILIGKLHNCRWVLERATRDHHQRINVERVKKVGKQIFQSMLNVRSTQLYSSLLGIEGEAASLYFSVFDELILQNKKEFFFHERSRRPPMDNINALLSFVYMLLVHDVSSALAAVGLDPFVGFLHKDRPGRRSLALDLLEELRAPLADRFVLSFVNTRQIDPSCFTQKENGAVFISDNARRKLLSVWHERKQEIIQHPFIKEKIEWGLVPYVQALLLARHLRGDLDEYPPFLWK